MACFARIAGPVLAALILSGAAPALGPDSGKPVPRWESLKTGEVNGRQGPSLEHRVLWTYHRRGLPVRVVAETEGWRKVIDPAGDSAWVHAGGLDSRRTVFVASADPAPLRRAPRTNSKPRAFLEKGVVAGLRACKDTWRRLQVGDRQGWTPAAALWGADACE
jgi:SH3-like domain-containing protein